MTNREVIPTEKARLEWDGGTMSLVYAIPSNYKGRGTCVVIAHGAGGPMYSPFISFFHTELARMGSLTVKFNFPYMEARKKVPDRAPVLEESFKRIAEHVRSSKFEPSRVFLGGKSMGGRIASQAVAKGLESNGLFFLGYPLHAPGRQDRLRDEHLYDISCPMFFASGTRDNFARRDLLEKVVNRLGTKATVHWIADGDHSLNAGLGKEALVKTYNEVARAIDDWLYGRNVANARRSAYVQAGIGFK